MRRLGACILAVVIVTMVTSAAPRTLTPNRAHIGVHIDQWTDSLMVAKAAQMMDSAGAEWVRYDIRWADVEPTNDNYSWTTIRRDLQALKQRQKKVLALISYAPSFAYSTCRQGANYPWWCAPDNSTGYDHYKDFLEDLEAQFADTIDHYEVWNETFNESDTYATQGYMGFDGYPSEEDSLILHAHQAVGATNYVVCCGCGRGEGTDQDYAEEKLGRMGGYIDVVSLHAYATIASVTAAENHVNEVRGDIGSGKSIWVTECGSIGDGYPLADASILARVFPQTASTEGWDKSFLFTFNRRGADADPLVKYTNRPNFDYPRPDSINLVSYCQMVQVAGNLSDVGTCIHDLDLDPTFVPPNVNCTFTASASSGSYPEAEVFEWYRNGGYQPGKVTYQEVFGTDSTNFTLKASAGPGYYDETFNIVVSSEAPMCVERR